MKEATGELSTTVIAIVAIAAVLTIFTIVLLPTLKSSLRSKMYCASAICPTTCQAGVACTCEYYPLDDDGTTQGNPIEVSCDIGDR